MLTPIQPAMTPITGCDVPSIQSPQESSIAELQRILEAMPDELKACIEPMREYFEGGVAQAICIPAGTVLVGKRHRHPHLVIMLGDISVQDEKGIITRMCGFRMFRSPGGIKRAGYAHADTIFINVHATELTGGDASEAAIVEDEPANALEVHL